MPWTVLQGPLFGGLAGQQVLQGKMKVGGIGSCCCVSQIFITEGAILADCITLMADVGRTANIIPCLVLSKAFLLRYSLRGGYDMVTVKRFVLPTCCS